MIKRSLGCYYGRCSYIFEDQTRLLQEYFQKSKGGMKVNSQHDSHVNEMMPYTQYFNMMAYMIENHKRGMLGLAMLP